MTILGIDLGTSHCALAYENHSQIKILPIPQLVALGQVAPRELLPSLRYHGKADEFSSAQLALPWATEKQPVIIGELARELGSQRASQLVVSAKSWLCHQGIDREQSLLPWGSSEIYKISPISASASYLRHLKMAWESVHGDIGQATVVLTVPASFDPTARALTLAAAKEAELPNVHLVEEPQAACYYWLQKQTDLNQSLANIKVILVVDIGGGTTDFSLISVAHETATIPQLNRIGVGDHLLLGGDNLDLALAHHLEAQFSQKLTPSEFSQLLLRSRAAKEQLLVADPPKMPLSIAVLGSGRKLVGGSKQVTLSAEIAQKVLLDGFFPLVDFQDRPKRRRAALVEFGLPYAAEPAITRHLADFLERHKTAIRAAVGEDLPPLPDALLLNGGVTKSPQIAQRLQKQLELWRESEVKCLDNDAPDLAVAKGAVAYAMARRGQGIKISSGAARSYYLKIGDHQGICLLPKGTPENQQITIERPLLLQLGQPVQFWLCAAIDDTISAPGEIIVLSNEESLPPLATVFAAKEKRRQVAVKLVAELDELGNLKTTALGIEESRQFPLAFELRGQARVLFDAPHPQLELAIQRIDLNYGPKQSNVDPKSIKRLRGDLEELLGNREMWPPSLLRQLADALLDRAKRRRRSPDHERVWINLVGYCLRPGYGYPLDEWRVEQLWHLYSSGLQFAQEKQKWAEWWTLWRRVAGGLNPQSHAQLFADAQNSQCAPLDALRLVGALEHLSADQKANYGDQILKQLAEHETAVMTLGRLGNRCPTYGRAENVILPSRITPWLEKLFQLDWRDRPLAGLAAVLMTRPSGDRLRDVDESWRFRVKSQLKQQDVSSKWFALLETVGPLDPTEGDTVFGERLPLGLKLID